MISRLLRLADTARHRARLRRWVRDLAEGRRGEDLAHRHVRECGYIVVGRNFQLPGGGGELDLIAWDGDVCAVIEVKSRSSVEFGDPDRAVTLEKQRRIVRTARNYARRANIEWNRIRFDTVSVVLGSRPQVTLKKDAFRPKRTL
jgi:putative endonuclease